jgi:transposase
VEAVRRIDAIFGAERDLHGRPVAERLVRRHQIVAPLVAGLEGWVAFSRFTGDGCICMTNNAAERAPRGGVVGRKAWLADVLRRIADHPASRLDELLPWNCTGRAAKLAA